MQIADNHVSPDRTLTHINKKGRPVSQCPHCRGLRKSRASHVKCECGEKPHGKGDCVHVEKGDSKSELGDDAFELMSDRCAVDSHLCCCSHGARCTCALKNDGHLDPVPEADVATCSPTTPTSDSQRKPRLSSAKSDPALTVFVNGHHKPAVKHNDAAHKCGLPYKIPRPHSIHGHGHSAQRSMDSLPLTSAPETPVSQFQESISDAQQDVRLVRSEHGSPKPRSGISMDQLNGQLPSLDLSYSAFDSVTSTGSMPDNYNYQPTSGGYASYFPPNGRSIDSSDQPIFSAGLAMPVVDWSAMDLPFDAGAFSSTYSQPPSYASFDHTSNMGGQPGLTTSSSGEVSEVEDYLPRSTTSPDTATNYTQTTPDQSADQEPFGLSHINSKGEQTYLESLQQAALLSNPNLVAGDNIDIDTFIRQQATHGPTSSPIPIPISSSGNINGGIGTNIYSTTSLQNSPGGLSRDDPEEMDPETFARHGFTVQDAQKLAHPLHCLRGPGMASTHVGDDSGDEYMESTRRDIPATRDSRTDPLWGGCFRGEDGMGGIGGYEGEDDLASDGWRS